MHAWNDIMDQPQDLVETNAHTARLHRDLRKDDNAGYRRKIELQNQAVALVGAVAAWNAKV